MQELLSQKRRTRKDISVQNGASVAMISNHKMRAVCSSLGHISLYDGLLPVITSDFDKKIKETYKIIGEVTYDKILKAKKIDSLPDEHEEQKKVVQYCKKNNIKYIAHLNWL